MRRALLILAFICAAATPAMATGDHHEQSDGCDHGATSKPCKEDPSENGKDCELHGNHGGINEDHCLGTTTTTQPPTTTTTTIPVSSTTTTTRPVGSPSTTTTTFTSQRNVPSPTLGCMTPDGQPYLTNIEQGGCPQPISLAPAQTLSRELPRTGFDAGLLFVIGTAVLLAGLSCWFAGKAIE